MSVTFPSALFTSSSETAASLSRLGSGTRITSPGDDPAGLAIGNNLSAASQSQTMGMRNANDGIAMAQTADGATGEVSDLLTRMRELAVQASSDTLSGSQRGTLQTEFDALSAEIDRIAGSTEFNGINLTDGSAGTVSVQVGTDGTTDSQVDIDFADVGTGALGLGTTSIGTSADARNALADIDAALDATNQTRSSYGASINALESSLSHGNTQHLALQSSFSRIMDTDYALESANLASNQLMTEIDISIQAQANKLTGNAFAASLI